MNPTSYRLFGWLFTLTTFPSILLHILVGLSIRLMPTYNKRIVLRIMFFLIIADGCQAIIHLIQGIATIIDSDIPDEANMVIGVFAQIFMEAMIFFQLALAVNRFYIITRNTVVVEPYVKYFDLQIVISWLVALLYAYLFWIGGRRIHYEVKMLGWVSQFPNSTVKTTDLLIYLPMGNALFLFVGLLLCVLAVLEVAYKRKKKTTNTKFSISSLELRILFQISIIYVLGISNSVLWNRLSNPSIEVQGLLHFERISTCNIPPYLNLLMSSDIRSSAYKLIMSVYGRFFKKMPSSLKKLFPKPPPEYNVTILYVNSTVKILKNVSKQQKKNVTLI